MFEGVPLNIVSDLELSASQAVKTILLILLSAGIILNIYKSLKSQSLKGRTARTLTVIALLAITIPVMKWYDIEGNMLHHPEYTTGVTVCSCSEFAKGAAIEFVYEVNNVSYRNCNAYHPVPREKIRVPGGKYYVRYSRKHPAKGRMDFNKIIE